MALPDFLVIGAPRAGTTSLHNYLGQHPQIFMCPVKEPNFFRQTDESFSGKALSEREYEALFDGAKPGQRAGEGSPAYLVSQGAPGLVSQLIPEATMIAVLRDPAERAFSDYQSWVRSGGETLDFDRAVADGRGEGVRPIGHYLNPGFYFRHLSHWLSEFPRERLHIFLYEDLIANPAAFLATICEALGIDSEFCFDAGIRYNPSGKPRNRLLQKTLEPSRMTAAVERILPATLKRYGQKILFAVRAANLEPVRLDPVTRKALIANYREDILKTQDLLGRDLSAWLR
ncbi:MAG: sulfotransferase [Gammaproteobacteria bacterium]|nr:MAG: sulfotransferase [Gammaproteobacteria bacterium]